MGYVDSTEPVDLFDEWRCRSARALRVMMQPLISLFVRISLFFFSCGFYVTSGLREMHIFLIPKTRQRFWLRSFNFCHAENVVIYYRLSALLIDTSLGSTAYTTVVTGSQTGSYKATR